MNESLKISRIVASRLKLLIGVAALFVGSLVYIIDRPPDHTYFVYIRDLNIIYSSVAPPNGTYEGYEQLFCTFYSSKGLLIVVC